jgi:tetratricopeptide (TPR) repeat protein
MADYHEAVKQATSTSDPRAEMLALVIGGSFWASVGDAGDGEEKLKQGLAITRRIGSRLFEGVCLYLLGRFALLQKNPEQARKLVQDGVAILRESESGMTFGGPIALGVLALAAESPEQCHSALAEAETILSAGSVGHNYLNFYEDAMEACLQMKAWDEVDRYAQALEDYTRAEPLPRSNFFCRRGHALAAYGRGDREQTLVTDLQQLLAEAESIGLKLTLPALHKAISSF